jgi:hypothetical protein
MLEEVERFQALRQEMRQPFFRVFSELDRWVRMHLFRQKTGLSKEAVALIFMSRDLDQMNLAILSLGADAVHDRATRPWR